VGDIMKEQVKRIIVTISMFYSLLILTLIIVKMNSFVTIVELTDSEENKNKLNEYIEKLNLLEKNDCTNLIDEVIKHYEDTSYDGKVKIKDMYAYDGENSLLSYYLKIKDACNFKEEILEEYGLPTKFITSSIQRDELYQRYMFQYELGFIDFYMRDIGQAALTGVEYSISKKIELEIIDSLINIYIKESALNE
jgi:hypothetical protein